MGILNNIVVSLPDTIVIATTPKEVILHSCPPSTSIEDVWLTIVIGIIVIFSLWIMGYYTCKSVASVRNAKLNELKSRQEHELAKMVKEAEIKTAANQFNAIQTKEQREWISEADRIKNKAEQYNLRLKEAEINNKIRNLSGNYISTKEQIKS